ncbi:MAG: hypothetical protein CVV33_01640, partial [Methanomicrobiales archaeon HGW-Methanomicrobiales-4]
MLTKSKLIQILSREEYYFTLNPDIDLAPMNVVQMIDNQYPKVLGPITGFIEKPSAPPLQIRTEDKPDISDSMKKNADASFQVGTSELLTKYLNFIFTVNTTISYQGIDEMEIKFDTVTSDSVYIIDVHNFIGGAKITSNKGAQDLCTKDKKCFVIYDILKASEIEISFKKGGVAAQKTDIDVILKSTNFGSSGKFGENEDGKIQYKGETPLPFAFKGLPFHIHTGMFLSLPSISLSKSHVKSMKSSGRD